MYIIPHTRMPGDCVVQSLVGLKALRQCTYAFQVSTFLFTSLPHPSATPVSRTVGNRLPPGHEELTEHKAGSRIDVYTLSHIISNEDVFARQHPVYMSVCGMKIYDAAENGGVG